MTIRIRIRKEIVCNEHRIIKTAEAEFEGTQSDIKAASKALADSIEKRPDDQPLGSTPATT